MKFKVTKKEMNRNYDTILGIGYCRLQNLLRNTDAIAYSVRAEGWACDYYVIDNILISTGYSPLKSKNLNSIDYYNITELDFQALSCNDRELELLLQLFIKEIKK